MQPKTKLQNEVWQLRKSLLEPKQHEKFVKEKFKFYYSTHYKNLVCLECNHNWKPYLEIWKEEVIGVECPSCKKKLEKISIQNGFVSRIITYSVTEVVGRFQVFRYFSCYKHMRKNEKPRYFFRELFEEWKEYEKNKTVIVGRTQSWSGDSFSTTDMEVRANSTGWRYGASIYDSFASDYNCPDPEFLPRFYKYGITEDFGCDYRFLLKRLEEYSRVETLLKSKQGSLLFHAVHTELHRSSRFWPQIKIAIRHKYKVNDAITWYDYLELLLYFGKDITSPKYVCPVNLKREHDRLVLKKTIIRDRQEAESNRKKIEADFKKFQVDKKAFIGLSFSDEMITVKVLESIEEFLQEGKILKHCVFTNNYHTKKDSLIMSARINNKPIETIEISLTQLKVIQARGFCNAPTDYHDKIVDLVNNNLHKIRKIVKSQKKLKTA